MTTETKQMITYQKFDELTFEEVRKYWENATNREKCLDLWAAISENKDGTTKIDFAKFMEFYEVDVEAETDDTNCYACVESDDVCDCCPIAWVDEEKFLLPLLPLFERYRCGHKKSTYQRWVISQTKENAKAVFELIEETWIF